MPPKYIFGVKEEIKNIYHMFYQHCYFILFINVLKLYT
jgi:hypothetical protein